MESTSQKISVALFLLFLLLIPFLYLLISGPSNGL
ncbi:MAG: hypothetical protein KatS3mg057_0569 [Herpetosiphonaceae bacterium]|nr:MAG: hypothetical protein KatS3mg057_0569 [Herpetosiphonaceae bacterium]